MTSKQKRNALKIVTVGALSSALPGSWLKPIVKSVVLPAHAQTSTMMTLDRIADRSITRQTAPDKWATGSIYWDEYHVAFVTGQNIQKGATYSLIEGPSAFNSSGSPTVTEREIRMDSFRNDRDDNEIFIYSNGLRSDTNGSYRITAQVKNPNGETAKTSFTLTLSGFKD